MGYHHGRHMVGGSLPLFLDMLRCGLALGDSKTSRAVSVEAQDHCQLWNQPSQGVCSISTQIDREEGGSSPPVSPPPCCPGHSCHTAAHWPPLAFLAAASDPPHAHREYELPPLNSNQRSAPTPSTNSPGTTDESDRASPFYCRTPAINILRPLCVATMFSLLLLHSLSARLSLDSNSNSRPLPP